MLRLPQNLLCSEHFSCSAHLETPQQVMALLNRSIYEQNACLKWLLWPHDFNQFHAESWLFSKDIWRVLFVPAFKKGDGAVRSAFLKILLGILKANSFSDAESLQISITLAAFNLVIRDSSLTKESLDSYAQLIHEIEKEIPIPGKKYFSNPQNLINIVIEETNNQFAISHFIGQMETTLNQLSQFRPEFVLGDWMINFFFVYRRVLEEASVELLKRAFSFALKRKATDEGVCAILDLFRQVGVAEETRFQLQSLLNAERIPRLWRFCSASIAKPTQFVSFTLRKAHFLATSRGFSQVSISSSIPEASFGDSDVRSIVFLAAVWTGEIDIYESQSTLINGRPLKRTIEETLAMVSNIAHWSIPGPNGTFLPSPCLQPSLFGVLISLMMQIFSKTGQ